MSATSTDYGSLVRAQHQFDPAVSHNLAGLLDRATACIDTPSKSQAKILERLYALRERFAKERFQLAVLGQFKRAKSTLLNALLPKSVLPVGIVPVTAIPTFLEPAAALKLRVTYLSGEVEEFEPKNTEKLRKKLLDTRGTECYRRRQGVCLRHFGQLLAISSPDLRLFLQRETSKRFRKLAADMYNYAAKREAVRRDLITTDEEDAALRALIRIASTQDCSAP